MSFLWPQLLWLLLAVPLLIALYFFVLSRRKKSALTYANLGAVKAAMGPGQKFRRHVPPLLFLLALITMLLSIARPAAVVTLPSQERTIILAMDVSGSMRARDVEPSRLEAAQAAAKTFISEVPRGIRIGIVSFAGTASVVQAPTENREDLIAAIDRFQLQRGTAIGSGIIISLATIFPDANIDLSSVLYPSSLARSLDDKPGKEEFKPVPPGSYPSAAVILLTDGQATTGPPPLDAAKMAADRGIRVYTVGVGTAKGDTVGFEGWSVRVLLDEPTLKRIAEITHGEYFYAGTADDLKKVYDTLNSRLVLEKKETEITALFSAVAAALVLAAAMLSLLWFNRVL
jgi:Ca-activated chloride channel homolog